VVHQGNHATFARQPAAAVIRIGDGLADERAVFLKMLGIALTPQLLSPVRFGEPAMVFGLGMVGNLAAQLCREAGAFPLVAVDPLPSRVELAHTCGIAGATTDRGEQTASYVIEAVGLAVAFQDALAAVEPDGRVIVLSSPREKVEIDPYFDIHHRGVQVIGAHEWRRNREERASNDPFLDHLLTTGRVRVDPMVTHRVAFADAQRAYEGLRDHPGTWLGVLLEYG
jgi:threonine dehydrogenase-like Zn-dependent dehydrogenase